MALQRLRKRKRLAEVSDDSVPESPDDGTPERGLDARRRIHAVYNILDRLSPKKRVVFILHEIEGREHKEIAQIVGAPVLTVRTRLHYAGYTSPSLPSRLSSPRTVWSGRSARSGSSCVSCVTNIWSWGSSG